MRSPTLTVTADGCWADAGNGAMKVVGSSVADIIYLGLGNKTVTGGGVAISSSFAAVRIRRLERAT